MRTYNGLLVTRSKMSYLSQINNCSSSRRAFFTSHTIQQSRAQCEMKQLKVNS